MPCFHPSRVLRENGHLEFSKDWRHAEHFEGQVVNLGCRDCVGCNQATQREWSVRAFHEAQLHNEHWRDPDSGITTEIPSSSVITLTFDEEHLPADGLLDHKIFQRFMKRLRIRRQRLHAKIGLAGTAKPIRFFMCGEYGGKTFRPHFHSIIFGESFSDQYTEQSLDGQINKMSYELDTLWSEPAFEGAPPTKIGRATVDSFTFAGAAYVAGYIAKASSTGGLQGPIAEIVDQFTGETTYRPLAPEYRKMSNRAPEKGAPGGLGGKWLLQPQNLERVYSSDSIQISTWHFHPPRYYDVLLKKADRALWQDVRLRRLDGAEQNAETWSPERCSAAEKIALSELQQRRDSL